MVVDGATSPTPGTAESPAGRGPAEEPFVSLYRRFRPGRFSELRGQPHVVLALQSGVRQGHVAHAYLFSGPRGTGKTSTARILARALNCAAPVDGEPCGVCPSCVEIARGTSLDVHELDAASNNGVDAMRDLVAHAALGTPGRWKVYIVDEVHMLSNAAANALLKTLEEPPGHVVFVLATTDPQKVPPTIRSRTQHFEFRLFGADTLTELLREVSERAGLELDDEALAVAVRRGRGSARDALSALDQVVASGSADERRPELAAVVDAVGDDDAGAVLVALAALHEAGWGPQQLAAELVEELRQAFLLALSPDLAGASGTDRDRLLAQAERLGLARLVRAMERLGQAQVDMRDAPDPRVVLEVALVRLARADLDDSTAALADRLSRLERQMASGGSHPAERGGDPGPPPARRSTSPPTGASPTLGAVRRQRRSAPATPSAPTAEEPPTEGVPDATADDGGPPAAVGPVGELPDRDALSLAWGDHVLRSLPSKAKVLYSAGRFVAVEDGRARFALPNAAHRDRCVECQDAVEAALATYFTVPVPLELVVDETVPAARAAGSNRRPATRRATSAAAEETPAEPPDDLGDDDYDPDGDEVVAVESLAEARLLEAFPGAQEVQE